MIEGQPVPPHWRSGNIRRFAQMKTGHTPSRSAPEYWEHTTIPRFTLSDVWQLRDGKQIYLGETQNKISKLGLEKSAAELLPAGTVILSRTASVGFSGIMPVPMATSQDFWNWICGPDLLPTFLNYQFKSMTAEFNALHMGSTHQTIYQKDAAGLRILVPPLAQQAAIVEFLDRETAQIDTLIAKQQSLIAALLERRTAEISHAVTKGLLLDVPLTPTGVDWIGDTPSSWTRATLRRVGRLITGTTPNGDFDSESDHSGLGRATPEDLSRNMHPRRHLSAAAASQVRVVKNAILVCCIGATVGKVGFSAGACSSNQQITAIETMQSGEFWYYALTAARQAIVRLASGNTLPIINNERLSQLPVVVPPMEEQRSIAAHLDEQTAKTDRIISKAEQFIELAKERRSALIIAAVTGQIDVLDRIA